LLLSFLEQMLSTRLIGKTYLFAWNQRN